MITEWPKADRRFLHWVNPPTNPRDIIITVPILQKSQLRDREVTDLIQGHTARCQSWDSNPGSYIPESGLLFHAVLFQVGAGSRKQQRGRLGTENTHSTGGRWAWRQKPPEWVGFGQTRPGQQVVRSSGWEADTKQTLFFVYLPRLLRCHFSWWGVWLKATKFSQRSNPNIGLARTALSLKALGGLGCSLPIFHQGVASFGALLRLFPALLTNKHIDLSSSITSCLRGSPPAFATQMPPAEALQYQRCSQNLFRPGWTTADCAPFNLLEDNSIYKNWYNGIYLPG